MSRAQEVALVAERERLIVRSAELRVRFARHSRQALQTPLQIGDRGLAAVDWARDNWIWIAAGSLLGVLLRPKRAISWTARLWWLWNTWRRGHRLWRLFNARSAWLR